MRRLILGSALFLGLAALAPTAKAQTDGFSDPFFLYYGFYLPRQAALAAQPGPEVSINALSAARQVSALTERAGLYDPPSALGQERYDPSRPFDRSGRSRSPRLVASGMTNGNINGSGPSGYYSNTKTYFPGLRAGRGANNNLASARGGSRPGAQGGRSPIMNNLMPTATSGMRSLGGR